MGIDDHAIADHTHLARTHDAGRQKAQLVADTINDQCMPSVVAALEANDQVCSLG